MSPFSKKNKMSLNIHIARNRRLPTKKHIERCNSIKSETLAEINDEDKILTPLTCLCQIMPKLFSTIRESDKSRRVFGDFLSHSPLKMFSLTT